MFVKIGSSESVIICAKNLMAAAQCAERRTRKHKASQFFLLLTYERDQYEIKHSIEVPLTFPDTKDEQELDLCND